MRRHGSLRHLQEERMGLTKNSTRGEEAGNKKKEKGKKRSMEGWAADMKPCKYGVRRKGLQLKPQSIKGQSPSNWNDMGSRSRFVFSVYQREA